MFAQAKYKQYEKEFHVRWSFHMELSSKKYKRVIHSQVLKEKSLPTAYKENHIIVNSKLFVYYIPAC